MKKLILQSCILAILLIASIPAQQNEIKTSNMDSTKTLSNAFRLGDGIPVAFYVPSTFKGSKLYLYFSPDTAVANYKQYYLEGSVYEVAVVKDKWLGILPADVIQRLPFMKVESDSAQTNPGGVQIKTIIWR